MLYNPKWNDDWSLTNLISWLETKDPKKKYKYVDCKNCLIAQYLMSRGWKNPNVAPNNAINDKGEYIRFPRYWEEISNGENFEWTYGAALKRAQRYL